MRAMGTKIIITFFIVIIILILSSRTKAALCQQTIEYIDGKLRNSKVEIAKTYLYDPDSLATVRYAIEWKSLWKRDLDSQALTIRISGEIFVLMESDRALSININLNRPELFPHTIGLHEISTVRYGTPMKFVKSITWNEIIYLLICYDSDFCNIYTSRKTLEFQHEQRTRHEMGTPTDAEFFIDNNQLYLVIATNLKAYPSPSTIYRWTGTYMDVIAKVSLRSVISIVTFSHKNSRILIFSQSNEQLDMGSQIYKLIIDESSGQGSLEATQFLPSTHPIAMRLYPQNGCIFLLVVNEAEPSQIFWWDGTEFLPWMQVEDIQGESHLTFIQLGNDIFWFIAQGTFLSVYKATSLHYIPLYIRQFSDIIRIVDIGIWNDGNAISVVVISETVSNRYRVEPLQFMMNKIKKEEAQTTIQDKSDTTGICLTRLEEKLKERMKNVEESRGTWEHLHPATENVVINSLEADVILRSFQGSTTILDLDIVSNTNEEIIPPTELMILMEDLEFKIGESLNKSQYLMTIHESIETLVLPSLDILNEANFTDLDTPTLVTKLINNENPDGNFFNAISATKHQQYRDIVQENNVTINNLEVESLCGIPSSAWLLRNESKKIPLKPLSGLSGLKIQIQIINDTVFMTSDILLPKFETEFLNSVNITSLLNNLFIPGKNQIINGDVLFENLFVDNLIVEKLDGVPVENLLTITTDQDVNNSVYADSLDIQHLYVNKINGISPAEAAKTSDENFINGKVIVNNLKITDELIIDDKCNLFKTAEHVQVYENVTIIGSVTVGRLQLESHAKIQLEALTIHGNDMDHLVEISWTKSTNQTLKAPIITFENGLTIHELNVEYLNGLKESEYLYTAVENIPPEFGHIYFEEFVVNGTVLHENYTGDFIEITDDALVFNEKVFFRQLNASNILTTRYNGIPINTIMNDSRDPNDPIHAALPDDLEFQKVIVNDNVLATDLYFETVNDRNVSNFLFVDQNHKVENVTTSRLRVVEFRSSSPSAKVSRAASAFVDSAQVNVIIQGQLIVEDNLLVEEYINEQSIEDYFDKLSKLDIQVSYPHLILDEMNVLEEAEIPFLHSINFDKFVENILSKTKNQTLIGTKTFHRVTANNIDAGVVNDHRIEEMYFVNDSLVFEGDVTFTNFSADVDAFTINTIDTKWFQQDMAYVLSKNITHMTLTGTATWESSGPPSILSDIIEYSVRTDNDEVVVTSVDLSAVEDVVISSLYTKKSLLSAVEGTINDAVLDGNNSVIKFSGMKTFSSSLEVKELIVNILEMNQLEMTTISDLNATIVRKFESMKIIDGTCTFSNEIGIIHLETPHLGPGMPNILSFFILSEDTDNYFPNGHFTNLVIKGAVQVLSLDGINIERFLKDRVTLAGNHAIQSNVRFNGHISVLGNVEVETKVNGVNLSDIILKDSAEPQLIGGNKIFYEDLVVEMDLIAPFFNGVNISDAFNSGILNDESALITGNIIIEGKIELLNDTTVSGRINGLQLDSLIDSFDTATDQYLNMTEGNITAIDVLINNSTNIITGGHALPLFHYFEFQEQIETPYINSISRVIPIVIANITSLNIYASQSGEHCPRLPEGCPCRTQYIIELSENGFELRQEDDPWVVFNFPETNKIFTISIATNAISSGSTCRSAHKLDEFTAINWMARNNSNVLGNFTHYDDKIPGYLSDAQVFVHDEAAYIVLVMFYDVERDTHEVDSLIYKLDLQRNQLSLELRIPTVAATGVEVFKIAERGSYILIAAEQSKNQEDMSKSFLYRIKPGQNEFELLRSFYSGGTRRVKSLSHRRENFVLVDDMQTNAVHIYNYKETFDNFYLYQSLYFNCRIRDIQVYYSGEFQWSDAHVLIITEDSRFFLYQYMMVGKFEKRMSKLLHGILAITPFHLPGASYLLMTAKDNSTIYRCITQRPD